MIEPLKLTKEQIENLKASEPGFKKLRVELNRMKKAGVDVTAQINQLEKAESTRKGLLREFGNE